IIMIMAAHRIPYIATACSSYPLDLYEKFLKAKDIRVTRYIHIFCPCPPGWGYEPPETIEIGRLGVRSGVFNLFEIEEGKLRFSGPSWREPTYDIESYLKAQKRFGRFTDEQIEEMGRWARDYRQQLLRIPQD
ncbi:MAG: pyruvate synthase subunit beta, partial [Planctomycetota bacterium]